MATWLALILTLGNAGLAPGQIKEEKTTAANRILGQMTLDEKLAYIGGMNGFDLRPIPRLNIPLFHMSDGPVGLRNDGPTTAYPAGAALAASFDPELALRMGVALGRDARARGAHFWLGPGVNLSRVPVNGRNFEYFGEDPILAGRVAAAIIRGAQSQGVCATVKHFAANDHESDRNRDSSDVDERTLRELHLRPFEIAVKEGSALAVMNGYNRLNGTYCSENKWLLTDVLKQDWGFPGVVMSDWVSTHSVEGPYNAGLDIEMPGAEFMSPAKLKPLIQNGTLDVKVLDDKVRRILTVADRLGWLKRPQKDPAIPLDDPASRAVALEVARKGSVLLQNQRATLPLDRSKVKEVLVVGPNADFAVTGGGGSAYATPTKSIALPEAIQQVAGTDVKVRHVSISKALSAAGQSLPDAQTPDGKPGLQGEYFSNRTLSGAPALVRVDPSVAFDWQNGPPAPGLPSDQFSVRWRGTIRSEDGGEFLLTAGSDDGIRVSVDGKRVIDGWQDRGYTAQSVMVQLPAGRRVPIEIEYYDRGMLAKVSVGMSQPGRLISELITDKDLSTADAVIVAVGFNASTESEGFDRPFELDTLSELMLESVTRRHKRTVAVVNSGAGVDMSAWQAQVGAILQAWYPGGEGNLAIGEILFGDTNPSGKLPTTFAKTWRGTYYEAAYPPVDRRLPYREGLLMGYRWFDAKSVEPAFPFGFGLSYTTFKVDQVNVRRAREGWEVSCRVRNTGSKAGAEVVQVYAEGPAEGPADEGRPPRELKGFRRVELRPGQSQTVKIAIQASDLARWTDGKGWVKPTGAWRIRVGTSSRDLVATANLPLAKP